MRTSSDRPTVCAGPDCENTLPDYAGMGRPRLFCSPQCRPTNVTRGGTLNVEVDYEGEECAGRPTGRVWLVRLRRGSDEVVIANELGRPSADHLASQISRLIDRRQRAQGGAME
jgi:hypothetical protein